MILFNGWIEISDNPSEMDFDKMNNSIIPKIEEMIKTHQYDNQSIELKRYNYAYFLIIGGGHNHDVGYSSDLKRLMIDIGELTPGSYGIVYVRFPEDDKLYNEFQVYKLAKGKFSIEKDTYLSPCVPIIEN